MKTLSQLTTESNNCASKDIDCMSSLEIAQLMNREDGKIIEAVREECEHIAAGIDLIVNAFQQNGRLFYCGCGTSGRLGVLDASECPPTFGTPPELVVGLIAGGDVALRNAVENAEDNEAAGADDLKARGFCSKDVVVGISASGRSPYVLGAMAYAKELGAPVIGVSNNQDCQMVGLADVMIAPEVGPEVIQGSTRLKSGTAQKMVLNMLSTGAMIRIGKVYHNLMVDMCPSNQKLYERALRLVKQSTGCTDEVALDALQKCGYHVKTAIIMVLTDLDAQKSQELLKANGGHIRKVLAKREEISRE